MQIIQLFKNTISTCVQMCKQAYRKITEHKINTMDTLKQKMNVRTLNDVNSIHSYISANKQRYKICENVYVNICEYKHIKMLDNLVFNNKKYNVNVINKHKLFKYMFNKQICLISEYIFYDDEKYLNNMQVFNSEGINKRFIPIMNELFKSRNIIFLVFSDKDFNIIGINKLSLNSMYEIVNK